MNNTPRRGPGGFPATPQTHRSPGFRSSNPNASTPSRPNVRTTLPPVPQTAAQTSSGPRIPTDILDAASQRFYAFAVYVGLWAWRTYDFYTLVASDQDSILTCFKWMGIDMVFMFCLPLLEIPWLEWSNGTAFVLFGLHAALDFMLMNRIGVPLQTWAISLVAFMWDSENAIGERSVKPGPILHNASLILGKQIINILPEGYVLFHSSTFVGLEYNANATRSAILNPYKQPFCLNSSVTHLELPILINQTEPVEIELWRIDLESNQNETITVRKSELRGLVKKARKALKTVDPADALLLRYPVKKTGVYMLKKVLDHSKLEVRPHALTAVVATCPQARVKPTGKFRCRNDLSDVTIEVIGVPPLRIRYSTTLNNAPQAGTEFESLQPDDFVSPLSRHTSQALIHGSREDVSWAQSRKVDVALNETLTSSGVRQYAIEEVYDALGNSVNYLNFEEDGQPRQKTAAIQTFTVLERPKVMLDGCSPQTPLKVAKGHVARLPVRFSSTGKGALDAPHTIEYLFTPEADLGLDGGHSENAQLKKQTLKLSREQPQISASGLYTINSVSTDRCEGEVLEPASCLLQNPPEPGLVLGKEDIVDKCAGNPIGLRVSMDLVGTPPFYVRYKEERNGGRSRVVEKEITSLRGTMDLTPGDAGHYTYTFESIRDNVYPDRPLYNLQLAQDVKPSASAHFMEHSTVKQVCIDDSVEFDVRLQGEGPWKLEYEIVHNGKRVKHSAAISEEHYTIKTQQLRSGGEYIVTLASITDKMGCKEFLKEEAKVNVRHERPKAYFGLIDGKQTVMALEGKLVDLPLRLTGAAPWRLEYENLDTKDVQRIDFRDPNARLGIKSEGTYQLLSVRDSVCPGFIDEKANQFHVGWIQRPRIGISESSGAVFEDDRYIKEAVCEGDEDSFDISLSGKWQLIISDSNTNNTRAPSI
jgi:nucleoporin POM152